MAQTAGLARNPPCDLNNCTVSLEEMIAYQNSYTLIAPAGAMVCGLQVAPCPGLFKMFR